MIISRSVLKNNLAFFFQIVYFLCSCLRYTVRQKELSPSAIKVGHINLYQGGFQIRNLPIETVTLGIAEQ